MTNYRRLGRSLSGIIAIAVVSSAVLTGCFVFRGVRTRDLSPTTPTIVNTAFKAHLRDGSVVVFRSGGRITATDVTGDGARYDVTRAGPVPQRVVPLDSVVGLEAYDTHYDYGTSAVVSTLSTVGGTFLATGLYVAIFGSCPTFYAWSDSTRQWALQAEAFSTAVGPRFEGRDVDRLVVRPDANGVVRIEGRNEAAETHYLNQVALLEVRHGADETALPDPFGSPIVVRGLAPPVRAEGRRNPDVLATVRASDGDVYATDATVLRDATPSDYRDTLEVAFAAPAGADSVAVVLRMRNSLLTTVLLYDGIMGDQGPNVLDWFEQPKSGPVDPAGIAYANLIWPRVLVRGGRLSQLFGNRSDDHFFGCGGGAINDAGPLAWRDVAIMIPVLERDSVVVRLAFPADLIRIDRIALATHAHRARARAIPVARVVDRAGRELPDAVATLAAADTTYATAQPGDVYQLEFDTGRSAEPRSFFLAARGYYIEWLRPSWMSSAPEPYTGTPERLVQAMRRWRAAGSQFERRFYARRVSVR